MKKLYDAPHDREILLCKEIVNGTFPLALAESFRYSQRVFIRYEKVDEDERFFSLVRKSHLEPLYLKRYGVEFLKEMAWLPVYVDEEQGDVEWLYNPKKFYSRVERRSLVWERAEIDCEGRAEYPYYEKGNEGLYGIFRDDSKTYVGFFSLVDDSFRLVAEIPSYEDFLYVGYVKGAFLLKARVGDKVDLVSVTLDGRVGTAIGVGEDIYPLSDFGAILVVGDGVKLYSEALELLDEEFVSSSLFHRSVAVYARPNRYNNGSKVFGSLYYPASDTESIMVRVVRDRSGGIKRIIVRRVNVPFWKYNKWTKYHYLTDGFLRSDKIALIDYNELLNNIESPRLRLPDGDKLYFQQADCFGDFVTVKVGDETKVMHTYDFKEWNEIEGIGGGVNVNGRIYVERSDNIVGFMGNYLNYSVSNQIGHFNFDGYLFLKG